MSTPAPKLSPGVCSRPSYWELIEDGVRVCEPDPVSAESRSRRFTWNPVLPGAPPCPASSTIRGTLPSPRRLWLRYSFGPFATGDCDRVSGLVPMRRMLGELNLGRATNMGSRNGRCRARRAPVIGTTVSRGTETSGEPSWTRVQKAGPAHCGNGPQLITDADAGSTQTFASLPSLTSCLVPVCKEASSVPACRNCSARISTAGIRKPDPCGIVWDNSSAPTRTRLSPRVASHGAPLSPRVRRAEDPRPSGLHKVAALAWQTRVTAVQVRRPVGTGGT